MLDIEGSEELELDIENLVKYEDVFLERKSQIRKSLDHITSEPLNKSESDIVRYLNISLSGVGEPSEEFNNAMMTYLKLLMVRDEAAADRLNQHDVKNEFVEFVLNSIIDYGSDLQRMNFRQTQGENWWSFVDLDRIVNESGIRHQHKITIDTVDTLEIHSTPRSDWTLARHMLDSIYGSYLVSENLQNVVDLQVFNQVRQYVHTFEHELKEAGVELEEVEIIEPVEEVEEDNV